MTRTSILFAAIAGAIFVSAAACGRGSSSAGAEEAEPQAPASELPEEPERGWAIPEGWRSETIPFPLGFAPELPLKGHVELRFPPGFFEPEADDFWSYAFAWSLENEPELSRESIEGYLTAYFTGLSEAVGGDKYSFDPQRFGAQLEEMTPTAGASNTRRYRGTFEGYDPFVSGDELTLHVDLQVFPCPEAGLHVALFAASPKRRSHPIWEALDERVAVFQCPS